MYLTNEELYSIHGGAISISGLNSVCRFVDTMLSLGRLCGSTVRKMFGR
jgi:hypothetical protein